MGRNNIYQLLSINRNHQLRLLGPIWILILFVFFTSNLKADCLACWKLKYVEIENNNGEVSKGYIKWSDISVSYSEQVHKKDYTHTTEFCDTIATYFSDNSDKLIVFNDFVFNRKLFGNTAIAVGEADTIDIDEMKNILTPIKEYSGYEGAGAMPGITKSQSDLFVNKPIVAMYKTAGWGFSDAYYLSYDVNIREEELIEMAKNRDEDSRFDGKIILIEIHYD